MNASQRTKASPEKKSKRRRSTVQPVGQEPTSLLDSADPLLCQRAIADPAAAPPDSILALQRSYGNWAVSSLVQAKLTVGPVGDRYEREADRVADQVMASGSRESGSRESGNGGAGVQRQELEDEELQAKPLAATITPLVQRQELEEEELQVKPQSPTIQRQGDGSFEAGRDVESRLASRRGSGEVLPDETRADMESRFGADFSGVRVHADGEAVRLSRELGAKAFTHGRDVYFGAGSYDPDSTSGQRLLAHELTHVVQQTGGQVQRQPGSESLENTNPDLSRVPDGDFPIQRLNNPQKFVIEQQVKKAEIGTVLKKDYFEGMFGEEKEDALQYWHEKMLERVKKSFDEAPDIVGAAEDWDPFYKEKWNEWMKPEVDKRLNIPQLLGRGPGGNWSTDLEEYWHEGMKKRIEDKAKEATLGTQPEGYDDWEENSYREAWDKEMKRRIKEKAAKEEMFGKLPEGYDDWPNAYKTAWDEVMDAKVKNEAREEGQLGKGSPTFFDVQDYKNLWQQTMEPRVRQAAGNADLGKQPPDAWAAEYKLIWQQTMEPRVRQAAGNADLGKQPPDAWAAEYKLIWNQTMDNRITVGERLTELREGQVKGIEGKKKGWGKTTEGQALSPWIWKRGKQKKEREQALETERKKLEEARESVRAGKRRRGARAEKTPWEVWLAQQAQKKKEEEAKEKLEKTEEETGEGEKTGETPPLEVKLVLAERHYNLQVKRGEETETIRVTGDGGCFYHSLARAKMIHNNPEKYATMSLEELKNLLKTPDDQKVVDELEKTEGELRTMFADKLVALKGTDLPLVKDKVKQAFVDIASDVWGKTTGRGGNYDGQTQPMCSGLSGERTVLTNLIKGWLAQKEGIEASSPPEKSERINWLQENYPPTSKTEEDLVDLYITEVRENRKFYADVEVEALFNTEELRKALGFGYVKMRSG